MLFPFGRQRNHGRPLIQTTALGFDPPANHLKLMQTKTKTTTTPAPKPDAQPVQAASFTPTPWKITRPHPDPETAAYLVEVFPGFGGFDGPHSTQAIAYLYCAKAGTTQAANADLIVRAVNAHATLLAALEAVAEAGRMSDQPRAVYCALIAQDALNAAKGGAQ